MYKLVILAMLLGVSNFAFASDSTPISSDGSGFVEATSTTRFSPSNPGNPTNSQYELIQDQVSNFGMDESGTLPPGILRSITRATPPPIPGESGSEVVIGRDTRVRINPRHFPSSATVLIVFGNYMCSGWLNGRDTVITAGHCVHEGKGGGWYNVNSYRIYPGYDQNQAPFGYCNATKLFTVNGWAKYSKEGYDYGGIKLDCNVGNTVGWYGFMWKGGDSKLKKYPATIPGYPGEKSYQQWQSNDTIRVSEKRLLFYPADTTGGMSGSPVWYDRKGATAIGIHAYRKHGSSKPHSKYNHGPRITESVFNNLISWRNASK